MTEPKPGTQYRTGMPPERPCSVPLVVSLDWAQVLHRQQQLLNEHGSGVYLRIYRDEGGLVRIDLND